MKTILRSILTLLAVNTSITLASTNSDTLEPFQAYCEKLSQSSTAEAQTLKHLMKFFKTTDCKYAENALIGLTAVEYEGVNFPQSVSDLGPLAYAKNLKIIWLPYGSEVSNLSPLSKLTELKIIKADASKIKDIEPLKNLTNLEELGVRSTKIKDITPIMELSKIRSLDLRHLKIPKSQISDFKKRHTAAEVLQ